MPEDGHQKLCQPQELQTEGGEAAVEEEREAELGRWLSSCLLHRTRGQAGPTPHSSGITPLLLQREQGIAQGSR